tara:strand:+ start:142 stop:360 length:219 start_codon:yes stop_codon:yes gene_type:complete
MRRGKFHRRPPRLRRQNHRRQGENAEKGKKKKEKTHFRRRLQSILLISLCISLSRTQKAFTVVFCWNAAKRV